MVNFWVLQCVCVCLMLITVSGSVVLIGNNVTLSLEDIEANFAPSVKSSGKVGILYKAEPLNACSSLKNEIKEEEEEEIKEPFVLIIRGGGCSFEDKVRRAQSVGFKAVIIFDNQIGALVAMAGNSVGIKIPAIFVSKSSGETLMKYINNPKIEIWILQSFEDSAWSIMAISFILLLAMSAVLATCFFIKRHRIRRERPSRQITEYNNNNNNGMSKRLLKAIPTLIFNIVQDDLNNTTSTTCAICLEDYTVGDKLRVLPCHHKFHAMCVDAWLTSWRTFCPVCKRDVRTTTGQPPPSEATPLLSSFSSTMTSSSVTSSLASSSSAIHINHHPTYSRSPSVSNTPYNQLSYSISRSSMDLRNNNNNNINGSSSQRSRGSFLVSSSPLNSSRYMLSPYIPSPGYNIGSSSSRQINALHISDSAASFSPFASAQSLPGVD